MRPNYKKGTFGYWWTVEQGNEDIKGKTYKGGDIQCSTLKLTSLDGAPRSVNGDFNCSHNNLTSLKGAPKKVSGDFHCYHNKLTSLEDAPEIIGRGFYCGSNSLHSLKGAPKKVGTFSCSRNNLTSLEGAPEEIDGDFYCYNNNLNTLKSAPKIIKGNVMCTKNPKLKSLVDLFDSNIKGEVTSDLMTQEEFKKEQQLYKKLGKIKYLKIKKLQGVLK